MPVLQIRLKFAVGFYSALSALALVWSFLRGDEFIFFHPEWDATIEPNILFKHIALGLVTALAVVILSRLASQYFETAKLLELEFGKLLGRLGIKEIVALGVLSGFGEEMFFRGAMQPTIGIFATTFVFGLLHIGPSKLFLPWTISAFILGGVLGYYFEVTGNLAASIVCHMMINIINLIFIQKTLEKALSENGLNLNNEDK